MAERVLDKKNRWRNVVVAFRVSPEESEEIDKRVKLLGYRTKQEYLIQSVLNQEVVATGNPLMMVQFRKQLRNIEEQLIGIYNASEIDEELFTPIRTMLEILEAFQRDKSDSE